MTETKALIPRDKAHAPARQMAEELREPITTLLAQLAPTSRRGYAGAIRDFILWLSDRLPGGADPLGAMTKATIAIYRHHLLEERGLAPATTNRHLSAIRQLALEAADAGMISPQKAQAIKRVKGAKVTGQRVGTWLTKEQAQALLDAPNVKTKKGARDSALLALMLRCGLRRSEVTGLTLAHIGEIEGHGALVNILGKRGRVRSVPLPGDVWRAVRRWLETLEATSGRLLSEEDRLFVGMGKGDRLLEGESMTPEAIWHMVKHYAESLGLPPISPHDLRRSMAKLNHNGGATMTQLQVILGHQSLKTTEGYVKVELDMDADTLNRSPIRAQ